MNCSPEPSKSRAKLAHLNSRKFALCLDCSGFSISGQGWQCAVVYVAARRHTEEMGHRVMLTTTWFEEYYLNG